MGALRTPAPARCVPNMGYCGITFLVAILMLEGGIARDVVFLYIFFGGIWVWIAYMVLVLSYMV